MELTDNLKAIFQDTANALKGAARRVFIARIVEELGPGGQRQAQRELGWNRDTLRKGAHELHSGVTCVDAFALRGRHRVEVRLPHLLDDIRAVVDGQSQTDPQFRNNRLYTRLTAGEVRRQLLAQRGYTDSELPCVESIRRRLTRLGYQPSEDELALYAVTSKVTSDCLADILHHWWEANRNRFTHITTSTMARSVTVGALSSCIGWCSSSNKRA